MLLILAALVSTPIVTAPPAPPPGLIQHNYTYLDGQVKSTGLTKEQCGGVIAYLHGGACFR